MEFVVVDYSNVDVVLSHNPVGEQITLIEGHNEFGLYTSNQILYGARTYAESMLVSLVLTMVAVLIVC